MELLYEELVDGKTYSCCGKVHSSDLTEDKDLRSCWPEMRAAPPYIWCWESGALNEECRMPSSYLTDGLESWPGVELGRIIPDGDVFQFSPPLYDVCAPCERWRYSGLIGEVNVDDEEILDSDGVVPLDMV